MTPRRRRAVAVCALAVTAQAEPGRGVLVSVAIPADASETMLIEGDALYVMSPDTSAAGPAARTVAMYRLPDGRLAWQVTLDLRGPIRDLTYVDGTLLGVVDSQPLQTIALRVDTGHVAWRHPGWWHPDGAGNVVLFDQRPGEGVQRVHSVALWTGAARWSFTVPAVEKVMAERGRFVR